MPIALEDLSVLAYANGFTLWHLRTSEVAADLCAGGGLKDAADLLRPGDMVIASGTAGPSAAGVLIVADVTPDGVAASPLVSGPESR